MRENFKNSLNKSLEGQPLNKEDVICLLKARDEEEKELLFSSADQVRQRCLGDEVHFRAIIEFSNYCKNNCEYCGLRRENKNLKRYRMEHNEIIEAAMKALQLGFKTIILQSGENNGYSSKYLAELVKELKNNHDIAVTLSLGEASESFYDELFAGGADRYLLKHETADEELFSKLRPGTTLDRRVECIRTLKKLGYQVGSGNIVGLPGQTIDSLAEDIFLMKELNVDMAGIGPFIPSEFTPLAGYPRGDVMLTLKVLAVARLALPYSHLPATTALSKIHPQGREWALKCGANVIMPDVTPAKFQKHYKIYPGKEQKESLEDHMESLKTLVSSMGRSIASTKGDAAAVKKR